MTKAERSRIASSFIGHFAVHQSVRDASAKAYEKPDEVDKKTAALINRTVKPSVPVTEADMPALNSEIRNQLTMMPDNGKKFDGGGTANFHGPPYPHPRPDPVLPIGKKRKP